MSHYPGSGSCGVPESERGRYSGSYNGNGARARSPARRRSRSPARRRSRSPYSESRNVVTYGTEPRHYDESRLSARGLSDLRSRTARKTAGSLDRDEFGRFLPRD